MDHRLDALEQLGRLRDQKVLTQAEFDAEKAKLLAEDFDLAPETDSDEVPTRWGLDRLRERRVWLPLAIVGVVGAGAAFGLNATSTFADGRSTTSDPAIEAATASATDQAPRFSAILKLDRPSECKLGDELATLVADLRSLEPGGAAKTITLGVNGPPLTPMVVRAEQGNAVIAQLSAPGVLEGLRVTELRTTRFDGSDTEVVQLRFAENPERVRTKLNDAGFAIPKPDDLKTVDLEDGHALVYGVERTSTGAALTCALL